MQYAKCLWTCVLFLECCCRTTTCTMPTGAYKHCGPLRSHCLVVWMSSWPEDISDLSLVHRSGDIACTVHGNRRNSADLPQVGLEIPCTLVSSQKNIITCSKKKQMNCFNVTITKSRHNELFTIKTGYTVSLKLHIDRHFDRSNTF